MSFPAALGAHIAATLLIIGAVWLVWVVLRMLLKTRPSATGGGKSAGSSERPRPWRRDAKAEGLAGPEAADTVPDGGGLLPPPPSGTTWACSRCGSPGRHDEWCYRPRRLVHACVHCPQMGDGSHDPQCPRGLDHHIDTAAALLQPDQDFFGWADDVDAWLAAGCPAVWPIPVVPGGES